MLAEKTRQLQSNLQEPKHSATKLSRLRGHSVEVPGLAKFCFAVAPSKSDIPWLLGPGQRASVVVTLHTDPQVALQEHNFKIALDLGPSFSQGRCDIR